MNYDNKEEMFPIVDEQGNITGAATQIGRASCRERV